MHGDLTPDKESCQYPTSKSMTFRTILSYDQQISAKEACIRAGILDTNTNRDLFYKTKSRLKKSRSKMLRGSPSTPSSPVYHSLRLKCYLCRDDRARITQNCSDNKSISRWYRTSNRNGEYAYKNALVLAFMWPSTGLYHANFRGDFTEQEARKKAADSFEAGGISKDKADELANSLEFYHEHRVYPVESITPFEITNYKNSLGLRIYSDKSHPRNIEVDSFWPTWTRILIPTIEKLSDQIGLFSDQIELHLKVLAQINESFSSDTETRGQVLTNFVQLTHSLDKLVIKLDKESLFSLVLKKVSRFLKRTYREILRKVPYK